MIPTNIQVQLIRSLAAAALLLHATTPAYADSRDEAVNAIEQLRQLGVPLKKPDDMGSIAATFSTAEQYLQQNNREMAERYYLLTLQKTRVLKSSLAVPALNPEKRLPHPSANGLPSPGAILLPRIVFSSPSSRQIPLLQKPIAHAAEGPAPPESASAADSEKNAAQPTSAKIVGSVSTYNVAKNDTLRLISAKLGVSTQQLVQMNSLDQNALLKIGQKLKYNNRKIVPQRMNNGIIINIPDRTLYYFSNGKLDVSLPVALGTPKKSEKYNWTTPTGKFRIIAKQKDPTWHVPPSIQSEMEEDGKDIIGTVPPGPTNPLGKYAIKTSLPGILIHSTTKPWSIYSFASHGCIRVYPQHMEEFFKKVRVNTLGEIIYQPVKLAVTENGRVFLEVHRDAYSKNAGLNVMAKQMIKRQNLSNRVDWSKVDSVIRQKAGLAEDITL